MRKRSPFFLCGTQWHLPTSRRCTQCRYNSLSCTDVPWRVSTDYVIPSTHRIIFGATHCAATNVCTDAWFCVSTNNHLTLNVNHWTRSLNPCTVVARRDLYNLKPETWNQKLETRNLKLETWNLKRRQSLNSLNYIKKHIAPYWNYS